MLRYKILLVALLAVFLTAVGGRAETWQLNEDQGWKHLSSDRESRYRLAVAQIKQLAYQEGQAEAVAEALNNLKADFPEIAGADLDAFIKAEVLLSKGKFVKAVRSYDKFLAQYPESKLYDVVLEREFAVATAFLAGQKKPILKFFKIKGYAEGEKIMDRISDRAGEGPIAVKATVSVAQSYEKRGKFNEAHLKWSEVASRWPDGEVHKDALLAMARCKHAAYNGPAYDSSSMVSTKSYYRKFRLRYPADAEKLEVDKRLNQIEQQQAYKQFSIGKYYENAENRESAIFYYETVIENWPDSIAAKMAKAAMENQGPTGKKEKKWKRRAVEKIEKWFL